MSCRGFLQCTLKLLNFLMTLIGAAMVLYSLWMLNQWSHRAPSPSLPPSTAEIHESWVESAKGNAEALNLQLHSDFGEIQQAEGLSLIMGPATKLHLFPDNLPAPWFIYGFLGAGILTCLITCTGHIAAETTSPFCLSCYTFFLGFLLLVQAAVSAAIFLDTHWREDIPDDPTGELDNIRAFILENYDICKWVGLGVLIVEALGLLLALTLRAVSDPRKTGYDSDDDYLAPRSGPRQPLLNRQATAAGATANSGTPAENRPARSDEWSKRMRAKYGLDTNEFTYNPEESRRFTAATTSPTGEEKKGCCSIM